MAKQDKGPATRVLSETIEEAVAGRRVKTAVFLTYQFDPAFFETQVLRLLFDRGFSQKDNVRLVQLDEELRRVEHMAVFYDRRGLVTEGGSARLDYQRIALGRDWAVFHPKNILLLVEREDEETVTESLILVTTSANLTQSGWWENVEVAHVLEIDEGDNAAVREDLLGQNGLVNLLKKEDPTGESHPALEAIRQFLVKKTYDVGTKSIKGVYHPRLFTGDQPLPAFITGIIGAWQQSFMLEVISPFFDDTDEAATLAAMMAELDPVETRVLLPIGQDGAALCKQGFYRAVEGLGARWSGLPGGITRWSERDKESPHRYVHAKVYRLFAPGLREEYIVSGSPNLTGAAHRGQRQGNFETAVFTGGKVPYRPDWWLTPLDGPPPGLFRAESEEPEQGLAFPKVSFRYDWSRHQLSYFWEQDERPDRVEVRFGNVHQFFVVDVRFDRWVALDTHAREAVEQRLRSSSFLEVWVDGAGPHRVLVREEGMEKKPSLLYELTSEEILEYWSQLTPEQRDAFLDRKLAAYVDQALSRARQERDEDEAPVSMFDRFAGIFHAFSCLQEYIEEAIEQKREKDADYRLFGVKHDSLPSLIDKVLAEEDEDRVNRYVRLLCAREVLEGIRKKHDRYASARKRDFDQVLAKLEDLEAIKAGFSFDTPEARSEFFRWFEDMFALPVELPEEAVAE